MRTLGYLVLVFVAVGMWQIATNHASSTADPVVVNGAPGVDVALAGVARKRQAWNEGLQSNVPPKPPTQQQARAERRKARRLAREQERAAFRQANEEKREQEAGDLASVNGDKIAYRRLVRLRDEHPDWPGPTLETIAEKSVSIGMTQEQVIAALGKPTDINRTISADHEEDQYVYGELHASYFYFVDGTLKTIQDDRGS